MATMNQAAFARHLGVRKSYITALKQAGRLVMTDDGKLVDVEASESRIKATAEPGHARVAARHAKKRDGQPAAVDPEKTPKTEGDEDPPADAGTPDYQKARARRETANAELAEMESATRAGQLMETALVLAAVADAGTVFRTTLDSRRVLLVSQLAMMADEAEIRLFLEEQDEHLLRELSERMGKMAKENV